MTRAADNRASRLANRPRAAGFALLFLLFAGGTALAQAPSSGPPLPHMVAPDAVGIDLLNGRRVGIDSAISVGLPNAPTLEISEGGGGLGGTPMGGFRYVDGSYPYFTDYFVLGNRGETNRYPDGTPRTLPDGMIWTGNAIVERDGTRWNFAGTGRIAPYPTHYLTSLVRPDGETLTYNYSSVPFAGDVRGLLRSITSSAGYQANFEWTPTATGTFTLTKTTLSNRRHTYCDPLSGACSGSTDRPTLTWSTDAADNVTVNSSGLRNVVYGARQQGPQVGGTSSSPIREWTSQITSGSGVVRSYAGRSGLWSAWPIPLYYGRQTAANCVDTAMIWRVTDAAGAWNYTYSNPCQPDVGTATRTDPLGRQASRNNTVFTDELGRTTTYNYINQWGMPSTPAGDTRKVVGQTLPEQNQISWNYGGAYSPQNLLSVTVTPKPGSGGEPATWQMGYPSGCTVATSINCHRPSYEIDPRGNRTDFTYDPTHGGVATTTRPADSAGVRPQVRNTYQLFSARVLNASGALVNETPVWRLVSTSSCRTQASCTGTADELVTSYSYDDNLLPIAETVRAGDWSMSSTVTRAYDHVGNLIAVDGPLPGSGDTTRYVYDRLRRLVATMGPDPDGGGPQPVPVTRTAYNGDNQPILVETGTAADQSDAALAAMTVLQHVATSYDAAGRKVRETVSGGGAVQAVTQFSYDAVSRLDCTATRMNPAAFGSLPDACVAGPAGAHGPDRITRNFYDEAGQLLQVQRAYGTPLQQNYATYTYTPNGRRSSVTDANGNRAELRYDGHDRQARWVFPHPGVAGAVNEDDYEAYEHDLAGNRTRLRKRDGTTLIYVYDNLDRMTSKHVPQSAGGAAAYSIHYGYDAGNRLLYARFGGPTGYGITNSYDAFGRLATTTTGMDGISRTLTSHYDQAGRLIRLTHPDGTAFSYDRGSDGRLLTVREGIDYTHVDQLITRYFYTNAGLRYANVRGAGTDGLGEFRYYDPVSRLSSLHYDLAGTGGDQSLAFAYNPASQIVQRTSSNDAFASNSAYAVNRAYAVNGLNQYTSAGPASFLYDANGNLRSDGSTNYVYDGENRLVSASGAHNATLTYDPLGRLFEVSGPAGTTRFLYNGDALIAEYDGWGTMLRRYVHGPGTDEPAAVYAGAATGFAARDYHVTDERGSIIALANADGSIQAINAYDAWGIPNATNQGRFGYTGQMWIPELGMWHYKARIYSPTLGRFLQTDPVGYEDQVNLYAYVGNDPVNHTDPTGMRSCGRFCWEADQPIAGRPNTRTPDDARAYARANARDVAVRDADEAFRKSENLSGVVRGENGFSIVRVTITGREDARDHVGAEGLLPRGSEMALHGQPADIVPGPSDDSAIVQQNVANGIYHDGRFGVLEFKDGRMRFTIEQGRPRGGDDRTQPSEAQRIEAMVNEYQRRLRR